MKVALGIIFNSKGQILITQRSYSSLSYPGFWEFPGGKLKDNETPACAVKREIKEEVNLFLTDIYFLTKVVSKGPANFNSRLNPRVNLFVYWANNFTGSATCCEGQLNLSWVYIRELTKFKFPEANQPILELLSRDYSLLENAPNSCNKLINKL